MNCATNFCSQGRQPCPTPWVCGNSTHRVIPPITTEGLEVVEFEEYRERPITDTREDEATGFVWALLIFGGVFVLGVLALPFIFGAV